MDHEDRDRDLHNFIEEKDHKGKTVLHYAVKSGSREMVQEVLTLLMGTDEKAQYADLMMNSEDEMGNTPFSYFLKTNGSDDMARYLLNRFDDKFREDLRKRETATSASGKRQKRKVTLTATSFKAGSDSFKAGSSIGSLAQNIDDQVEMLFASNKNGEIAIIEEYASKIQMPMGIVSDFVYEYISSIKDVNVDNVEWVGYCLLFAAQQGAMARIQLIIEKIGDDQDMLNRVLSARNQSHHDALYRLVETGKMRQFSWLLDEVPADHQCLYSQSLLCGDTTLMRLLEGGQLLLAQKLLGKINDNRRKLQLLNTRRFKRIDGGGSALEIAKRKGVEPVIEWLMDQINSLSAALEHGL